MAYNLDKELMRKTFSMGEHFDNFTHRSGQRIKIFPFLTNNAFVTSLSSVVGEWLRLSRETHTACGSAEETLEKILSLIDVEVDDKAALKHIFWTMFWEDSGVLKPNSVNPMCYIPCDDSCEKRTANYLSSTLGDHRQIKNAIDTAISRSEYQANVLEHVVLCALKSGTEQPQTIESYYRVHMAPSSTFIEDLLFVLDNPTRTKEYLVDLLEFYYFFYTAQTTLALARFEHGDRNINIPLYFSLDWEKTNKARPCYTSGWQDLEKAISQQFYHAITLEILNQTASGEQFDYIAIKDYLSETGEYTEVAEQIRQATELYRNAILAISKPQVRSELEAITKNEHLGPVFSEIHYLYESVRKQFQITDRGAASDRYIKHFREFCHKKFLKNRRSNGLMLNITEEFLIFLTKLAIKNEEQMSLNEVFHQFEIRGVYLDQPSRDEVVKFYTKLNLIDKKSDSGDAQYVKRIL